MLCEKCKSEHDGSFGSGRFCSKVCSNSRVFSEESKQKKRDAGSWVLKAKQEDPIRYAKFVESQREAGLLRRTEHSKRILAISDAKPWEEVSKDVKRRRVIESQDSKCNNCGLSKWQGQLLTLELEHKDGNHMNDERNNLEALCPNCHSITHTWRGRNTQQSKQGKISDKELNEALKATDTIRQALIVVGLSPRGGNYVRAKRLKDG
jgi:5-methylcytosine-specific restriction endonuclease McrA